MGNTNLDTLDYEILRLLTKNGRMPMGDMAKKLTITSPTNRNEIKHLEKNAIFTVSVLIDPRKHRKMITATVAMRSRLINRAINLHLHLN